jgi:DNA-binding NarL/FixJ family response regulator
MSTLRIILADDHLMFRQGLKKILEERADLEIIGEANCGLDLLKLLQELVPDLVILDISMPTLRGIEAVSEIKSLRPSVKILILTMHKEREYLYQSVSAGANGYLLKEDADTELFSAIETIRQGRIYISPALADESRDDWARVARGEGAIPFGDPLTTRERQVLKLIAEGKSSKEIGDLLFISARTVERHRANIMDKLGLKKTADLVKYAIQKGYV